MSLDYAEARYRRFINYAGLSITQARPSYIGAFRNVPRLPLVWSSDEALNRVNLTIRASFMPS